MASARTNFIPSVSNESNSFFKVQAESPFTLMANSRFNSIRPRSRSYGHEHHRSPLAQIRRELMWDQFEFRRISPGIFESLQLIVKALRLIRRFADRAHIRPSRVARDHSQAPHHRNTLARHRLNHP